MSDLNEPQDEAAPRNPLRRPPSLPPIVAPQKEQTLTNSSGSLPASGAATRLPVSPARPPSPLPVRPPLSPTPRPLGPSSETSAGRPTTSSIVRPPQHHPFVAFR